MIFKSRIKWAALLGLVLSLFSLFVHLFLAKSSNVNIIPLVGLSEDFSSTLGLKGVRSKNLWGSVKHLESLQPYANPRSKYLDPDGESNGFIYAKIFGGFANIRSSICDLVTISRLLNATLIIPEIQQSIRSKRISSKFKSFSYLYNEEQFIASLANDVTIIKSLPENFKSSRKKNEFPTFKPRSSASLSFYNEEVLPTLKKTKVIGLLVSGGGCLQSILPPNMSEFQRLRCRVAFHALHFRPEIQMLGGRIVERLRAWGQPFLAFHPGLVRDTLAYHGCAELFQDVHTELIQHQRSKMIKRRVINGKLIVDSRLQRDNGSCPLMPEEIGVLLRAMGYPPKTIIYLAGSETFGGQRVLIPFRAMFPHLVDRSTLCSKQELLDLVGPETDLPVDDILSSPAKSEEIPIKEWKMSGPRPRPLPPPPGRPVYRHEKEGWYGWITETDTEPEPSPMDLRMQAHRLLWDALDYIVSVAADAFFPGFHNDGSGWPDFSSLVMGQRLYGSASSRTYRPDRKILAQLLSSTYEDMYHPKYNWTLSVREHLTRSLGKDGLAREALLSKPSSFISHPLPECSCRISSADDLSQVKDGDGRFLYGGEDNCPEWMQQNLDTIASQSSGASGDKIDEIDSPEYENVMEERTQFYQNSVRYTDSPQFDQDEEMDPND